MFLREGINLSQKNLKSFEVFPYFFKHALNYFYFLTDECGFLKPKLDTWKNEGAVEFTSKDIRVLVQYESPGWVNVSFHKFGIPGRIYERRLFEILDIQYDETLLSPSQNKYSNEEEKQILELEKDIERTTQYLGRLIRENKEKIFSYVSSANNLV